MERYEVVTVTAVGKPGTQAFLGADAKAGATNIKVTSVANISVGDKIRLDIDTAGHGIETVMVTRVGTQAGRTTLSANAAVGSTNIKIANVTGFVVGDLLSIGTPANQETVTIKGVGGGGAAGSGIDFAPALGKAHLSRESAVAHGTGLELAAPLQFDHSANLPFSNSGTGIRFKPATVFPHSSNEPVQLLGTGILLDKPLTKEHSINTVVRDAVVTTAGYQGLAVPNQWFGGPVLSTNAGTMVLRDAAGLVVDSLNYGGLVDPWASEGYQAVSGAGQSGCRVIVPAAGGGGGAAAAAVAGPHRSAGRFPDGLDTDSNCNDFLLQSATTLGIAAGAGASNIKVAAAADFNAGQTIVIDTGLNLESAVIAAIGTAGASATNAATNAGDTVIPVGSTAGFAAGQTITIGDGNSNPETAVVAVTTGGGRGGAATITVTRPLQSAHRAGEPVAGSGITLMSALIKSHSIGATVAGGAPTPGAPNQYVKKR
jgi:hypothetical protein